MLLNAWLFVFTLFDFYCAFCNVCHFHVLCFLLFWFPPFFLHTHTHTHIRTHKHTHIHHQYILMVQRVLDISMPMFCKLRSGFLFQGRVQQPFRDSWLFSFSFRIGRGNYKMNQIGLKTQSYFCIVLEQIQTSSQMWGLQRKREVPRSCLVSDQGQKRLNFFLPSSGLADCTLLLSWSPVCRVNLIRCEVLAGLGSTFSFTVQLNFRLK